MDKIQTELPSRPKPFIGRNAELAALEKSLTPGNMVTVWGPSGVGKSALVVEALWRLTSSHNQFATAFPDGVFIYSFKVRGSHLLMIEALARRFQFRALGSTAIEAARRAMAHRRALIVIDSAERADDLKAIHHVCRENGMLITTRRRSDIGGTPIGVGSLPISDASELLAHHIGDTYIDADARVKLCEQFGRIPLHICLAGSIIAATKSADHELLSSLQFQPHDNIQAHSNMEDSQEMQVLLRKALYTATTRAQSILHATNALAFEPFDESAIAAVLMTPTPSRARQDVRLALDELVALGLVVRQSSRFELAHISIKSFLRSISRPTKATTVRLVNYWSAVASEAVSSGEDAVSRASEDRAHMTVSLSIAADSELYEDVVSAADPIEDMLRLSGFVLERLDVCRLAYEASMKLDSASMEAAWSGKLGESLRDSGQVDESLDYFESALRIARHHKNHAEESAQLRNLGLAYSTTGDHEMAVCKFESALAITRRIGDPKAEGRLLGFLGCSHLDLGNAQAASRYHEEALEYAQQTKDRRGEGVALNNLGLALMKMGQIASAQSCFEQALAISRHIGNRQAEGANLGNLAMALRATGETTKAIEIFREALGISRELGNLRSIGTNLGNLGNAYRALGQAKLAIVRYEEALKIDRETGNRYGESIRLGNIGEAHSDLGELGEAVACYHQAISISQELPDLHSESNHLGNLGRVYVVMGRFEEGVKCLERALDMARRLSDHRMIGSHLGELGSAHSTVGKLDDALAYVQEALSIAREAKDRRGEITQLGNLCAVQRASGNYVEAIQLNSTALRIAQQIQDRRSERAQLQDLALLRYDLHEFGQARELLERSLSIATETNDRRGEGAALGGLGLLGERRGDTEEAERYFTQAHKIAEETGDRLQRSQWVNELRKLRRLTGVRVTDIGPFTEMDIKLHSQWTVLLGDNGVGKSSALRAIALALLGRDAERYADRFIRIGAKRASLEVNSHNGEAFQVTATRRAGGLASVDSTPAGILTDGRWLAVAFPALRRVSWRGPVGPDISLGSELQVAADVLPLLGDEPDARLRSLEQWIINVDYQRLRNPGSKYARLWDEFNTVIEAVTSGTRIRLKSVDLEHGRVMVSTPDGEVPLAALSQGIASLLSWVGVLLQRMHEVYHAELTPRFGFALVIVDEIDVHLHPSWQQQLIPTLSKLFPNVQWVVTTHSPLIVSGLKEGNIVHLERSEDGYIRASLLNEPFSKLRADQILTGPAFGLYSTRSPSVDSMIERYSRLYRKPTRTPEEDAEFEDLESQLERLLLDAESTEQREVELAIHRAMRDPQLNTSLASESLMAPEDLDKETALRIALQLEWLANRSGGDS